MDILQHEPQVRLGVFVGVLLTMLLWEAIAPRRRRVTVRRWRWTSHAALVALNTLALRLIAPLGAVGIALVVEKNHWGLFQHIALPHWLIVVLSVLLLDLVIYGQHVAFHHVPWLWRLHRVHHADRDFDATTGVRFHTVEILLSLGIKASAIVLLGTPAVAVLIFEVVLNATSMFNHGNVRMPHWLDRLLRWIVVTPDMHRVHHSVHRRETDSNFGFNLPWWDRLFRTYRPQPVDGHEKMTIGLTEYRDQPTERLWWMLVLPVRGGGRATEEEKGTGG